MECICARMISIGCTNPGESTQQMAIAILLVASMQDGEKIDFDAQTAFQHVDLSEMYFDRGCLFSCSLFSFLLMQNL